MKSIVKLTSENGVFDFIIKWRMTNSCNTNCSYCIRKKFTHFPKDINAENENLKIVAVKLNKLIESLPQKKIKIDAIGGEVTLLDLQGIFSEIKSEKLKRVSITTNLLRSADYYISLAEIVPLSITASYHDEAQSLDDYFKKIEKIKNCKNIQYLNCETVSTAGNTELVTDFISRCEKIGVYYMVEPDRRKDTDKNRENEDLIVKSNKPNHARYTAVFSDGTEKKYYARSALLAEFTIPECMYGRFVPTKNLYCTHSFDFVYINIDKATGRRAGCNGCSNVMEVEDFKPMPAPEKCTSTLCSLCGTVSLYKFDK